MGLARNRGKEIEKREKGLGPLYTDDQLLWRESVLGGCGQNLALKWEQFEGSDHGRQRLNEEVNLAGAETHTDL